MGQSVEPGGHRDVNGLGIVVLREWWEHMLAWQVSHLDARGAPRNRNWLVLIPSGPHMAGEYDTKLTKMWLKFCRDNIKYGKGRVGHEEYQSYYFSQAVYALGDDKFGKMFPDEPEERRLKWSVYRDAMIERMKH